MLMEGFSPSCSASSFWPCAVSEGLWERIELGADSLTEASQHANQSCQHTGGCELEKFDRFFSILICGQFSEGLICFWGVVDLDLFSQLCDGLKHYF